MIDDPFRPPDQVGQYPGYAASPEQPDHSGYLGYSSYPPPTRRGWPSWVIVLVGVVSGLALAGASTAAVVGIATTPDLPSSSSSGSAPEAGGSPSAGPGDGSGDRTMHITFPDGSTGTFAVPAGLYHDPDDDDPGHVALTDTDQVFLDVYTDQTTASETHDINRVAQQNAADDRNHDNVVGPISYHEINGYYAAQYKLTHQDAKGVADFESLVTVVLYGDEQVSLYWSDDPFDFPADGGQQATAAVLHTLKVTAGGGRGTSDGSGSSA